MLTGREGERGEGEHRALARSSEVETMLPARPPVSSFSLQKPSLTPQPTPSIAASFYASFRHHCGQTPKKIDLRKEGVFPHHFRGFGPWSLGPR